MTEYVTNIPVEKLKPFPNHPFQVRDDDSMRETVESIKTYGVLQPAIVRPTKDGDYEILWQDTDENVPVNLPGGRRFRQLSANLMTMLPLFSMRRLSNLQRENILPSERAAAYKMKMEAPSRQAGRPLKNSPQVAANFRAMTQWLKRRM